MPLEERYRVERVKWDALAERKLGSLRILPPDENFETYTQRTSTMVDVREFLGDLCGRRVLEYGCGLGEISTRLAKSGAHVTTFDLSSKSVLTCRQRARLNGVDGNIELAVAAGERLPYAD